ncbi:MAG: CubicO group peptidase (beta-lactamase class C family) [Hyphomicrobiaceae bacterium]|jgi:CubicO group peptidase (beta-lactamase class C family)
MPRTGSAQSQLREMLDEACTQGVSPGAALVVGNGDEMLAECYAGCLEAGGSPVGPNTVFDLASLTKPLVTTAIALTLVKLGELDLDEEVAAILPEFGEDGIEPTAAMTAARRSVRVSQLLDHSSGLPAHDRFWERAGVNRASVFAAATATPLACPPGQRSIYSDIGFLVLGALIEHRTNTPLRYSGTGTDLFMGTGTIFPDSTALVAPTGYDTDGNLIRAVVNDDNARAMGGVAPHAGLFATASAVHRLAGTWIRAWRGEGGPLDSVLVRKAWTTRACTQEPSTWVSGWDTPNAEGSSAGSKIGSPAVGHLGFTGTSLWIDLERGVHVVLLTNRVHNNAGLDGIRALRPRIHDAIFSAFDDGRL